MRAVAAGEKAIQLDPSSAEGHLQVEARVRIDGVHGGTAKRSIAAGHSLDHAGSNLVDGGAVTIAAAAGPEQ